MLDKAPVFAAYRSVLLIVGLCTFSFCTVSLFAGDQLIRENGRPRSRSGTAVDETHHFIHWRAEGSQKVEKILKNGKVRVEYAVPLQKIRECDPTRHPDKSFALALEWLRIADASAQYHGRKLLWLTMHQHEDEYYLKGCRILLDRPMIPKAQREWLLRSALRKCPEDRKLLMELRELTGLAGEKARRKEPARTEELEGELEDALEPHIIDKHRASDSRDYRAEERRLNAISEKVPLLYEGSFPDDIDFSRPNYTGKQWSRQ